MVGDPREAALLVAAEQVMARHLVAEAAAMVALALPLASAWMEPALVLVFPARLAQSTALHAYPAVFLPPAKFAAAFQVGLHPAGEAALFGNF